MSGRRLIGAVMAVVAIVFVVSGVLMLSEESADKLTLAFLDVGQGDAVLIRKSKQYDVLIDGGPDRIVLSRLGQIMPWYDREIDLIFLTHNHSDHYEGLLSVLDKYQVGRLIVSALAEPLPQELMTGLEKHQVPYSKMSAGTEIALEPMVKLKALWPESNQPIAEMNDRSLVLELEVGEVSALLAGDSGEEVEEALLKSDLVAEVDVFKLSHHGSDTSNSQAFLEKLSPRWVVAQAGVGNSFGHPNRRILKRAERVGAEILRNDQQGTIVFETEGSDWSYELLK